MAELLIRFDCDMDAINFLAQHQITLLSTTSTDQELFEHVYQFAKQQSETCDHVLSEQQLDQVLFWISSLSFTLRLWGDLVVEANESNQFLHCLFKIQDNLRQAVDDTWFDLNREFVLDDESLKRPT